MKVLIVFILFCHLTAGAQDIVSQSYKGIPGRLFQGSSSSMKNITLDLKQLAGTKKVKKIKVTVGEYLVIAKQGTIQLRSKQVSTTMTPGSVALISMGDAFSIKNQSSGNAQYYLMHLESKTISPGKDTARSLYRIWEDISYRPHDKGGIRRFFDKVSSQTKRFEMHVTTLNAGLMSHDPHTHQAEEIVLILEGDTDMVIGDKLYTASAGDLYFLGSNVLHGIKNIGTKPSTYFAYQWD